VVYYLPGGVYFLGVDGNTNMESIMIDKDLPGFSNSTLILIFTSAAIVWICIIAGIIILIVK